VLGGSGFAGSEFRGKPDNFDAPSGAFRWGTGVAFPSRNVVRVFGELNGNVPNKDTISFTTPPLTTLPCVNCGGGPPITSNTENLTRATVGLTIQGRNGFFVGGGVSWNVPQQSRNLTFTDDEAFGDYFDGRVGLGSRGGVRPSAPPPPRPPRAPTPAPANRPPTVKATCDPMTVEVGKSSTCTADGRDPDGDVLTYRWTTPSGTLANP